MTTVSRPILSEKPASRKEKAIKTTTERAMQEKDFIQFAKAERDSRDARGEAEAEARYGLVQIGSNPNDPTSYGVMNLDGVVWVIGRDGKTRNYETQKLCPDQFRCDAINAQLEALGAGFRVSTKHRAIRRVLFCAANEVM